eukprot:TRINITY_DN2501_c0_g1_i1.p1 TRINITY_DN2501_c0_g1~~TRINITY_DN2501_c0_g1_i1.p1  ORF type:complete len:307 (+),score=68.37 TRINITY_DN2501_c0_g1_i1:31-921(+)
MKISQIFIFSILFAYIFASNSGNYNVIYELSPFPKPSTKYSFPSLNDYNSLQGTLLIESCSVGNDVSVHFASADQNYVYSGVLPSYRRLITSFSDSSTSPTFSLELTSDGVMDVAFAVVPFNLQNPKITKKDVEYDSTTGSVHFFADEGSDVEYAAIFCASGATLPYSSCGLKKLSSKCEMTDFKRFVDGNQDQSLIFEQLPKENGFIQVVVRRTSTVNTDIHNMAISFYNPVSYMPYPPSSFSPWVFFGILLIILGIVAGCIYYVKRFGIPPFLKSFIEGKKNEELIDESVYDQI